MTRDEITRMAREAGFVGMDGQHGALSRFAELVAAATRAECAALCDRFQARDVGMQPAECAAAIRARSEKGQS
jgi:hypothetical protein